MQSIHHPTRTLIILVLAVILTVVVADVAAAQGMLDGVAAKADAIQVLFFRVLRTLFLISAGVLGYHWVKGNHESRDKTERYLIGLAIAFGAVEIVSSFAT